MVVMDKSKYAEIGRRIRQLPQETQCSSYEWEELVQRLCASDDTVLHAIGERELNILLQRCPHCPVFRNR